MKNDQTDDFGNRMKAYEGVEAMRLLDPSLPIMVRLDGKCFHTFTRDLRRPHDPRLTELMQETCRFLVEKTNARIGYTQSDEISLALYAEGDSQPFLGARVAKIDSILAAQCSVFFNKRLEFFFPEKVKESPVFDCRAWNVPSKEECANNFVWRDQDAVKNSITMLARCHFSDKQLFGKSGLEKIGMLKEKGIDYYSHPIEFRRGTYFQRKTLTCSFTPEELEALPEKHQARRNPELTFERHEVKLIHLPPWTEMTNRIEVLFDGKEPELKHEQH